MSDFWSRRRAAVEAETAAEANARDAALEAERQAALEARSDAELLDELDLRDPDEMETPEEVQALLRAALPQRLKTRALRRLWRLNPVLANVDGLVDYGEDFTDAATVVENMQTAYQVGRGMLKTLMEDEPPGPATPDPVEMSEAISDNREQPLDDEAPVAQATEVAPPGETASVPLAPEDRELPAPRRRMRFRYDTIT